MIFFGGDKIVRLMSKADYSSTLHQLKHLVKMMLWSMIEGRVTTCLLIATISCKGCIFPLNKIKKHFHSYLSATKSKPKTSNLCNDGKTNLPFSASQKLSQDNVMVYD
ncbi:hypothetical protein HPP92_020500 [Vanilla planifolia]|uniref:Uncharacterized protein n=1 Tax=Vanilla planifolia TaxID=51239 RepID=A0A835UGB7_VANPL|nr:hypothetical protein HPP92_020500 [Vanilla planifolia]